MQADSDRKRTRRGARPPIERPIPASSISPNDDSVAKRSRTTARPRWASRSRSRRASGPWARSMLTIDTRLCRSDSWARTRSVADICGSAAVTFISVFARVGTAQNFLTGPNGYGWEGRGRNWQVARPRNPSDPDWKVTGPRPSQATILASSKRRNKRGLCIFPTQVFRGSTNGQLICGCEGALMRPCRSVKRFLMRRGRVRQ